VNENLRPLLEHLLNVLDSERQDEAEDRHRRALNWEPVDRLPVIMTLPAAKELRFNPYRHGEMFASPQKMLFNELVYAFNTSIASRDVLGDDLPCTIRANFGAVIIASMFGAGVEQIGDNPPWVRHDADGNSREKLQAVADCDPLDFSQGWCPRVVEMLQFYQSVLAEYPELKRVIQVVLPDLQGPFDNLELVVGSNVFAELHINRDLVCRALETMAAAQIGLARHLEPYVTENSDAFSHQHAVTVKGRILLRDDSVILMSPEMYRDVVAPHDERVLRESGGGGVHTCGKADGHLPEFLELPSIRCLDLGQPELNDIDALYAQMEKRRIPLARLKVSRRDLTTGRIMERFPTGVTLVYDADSIVDAQETMEAWMQAAEQTGETQ